MSAFKRPDGLDFGNDFQGADLFDPGARVGISVGAEGAVAQPNPGPHVAPLGGVASGTPIIDSGQRVLSDGSASTSTTTTTGTTKTTSTTVSAGGTSTTSPFVINITWDTSVGSAPVGFTAGVIAAAQYLESQFVDPVTVNINVGYGEVNGISLGGNQLGASYYWLNSFSYPSLTSALKADAKDGTDSSAVASLPSGSPVGNGTFWATTAQAKALGLASASNTATDGYVRFSSSLPFDYNNADSVTGYDFNGTALHEITEVLGRALLTGGTIGSTTNSYYTYDLFHYAAPGVRDFSASTPGYFSIDGGITNLGGFNTVSGGDAGDWGGSMGNDAANAFSNSGVVNSFSTADLTAMDAIGWDAAGSTTIAPTATPTPPTGVSVAALATSLSNALAVSAPIARVAQVGGNGGDTFTYTLGGTGAAAFTLSNSSNIGTLMSSGGLTGAASGLLYSLTVTANDTTNGLSSPTVPVSVIVGTNSIDTISVATVSANLGKSTPTFVYGQGSADTLNGNGMTGNLWFAGGGGGDRMTGGSGTDTYIYNSASNSTSSAMDIITNFNVGMDRIDLTSLGALQYDGSIQSNGKNGNTIAAHSVGWQVSGGNTFVYVNTSGAKENIAASNMKIELAGNLSPTSSDFPRA